MQANASVGAIAVNADGMIGAVNSNDRETEADPVFAERVVGPRVNLVDDILGGSLLLLLNRGGHAPGRIFAHLDHSEGTDRRLPLPARLTDRDRVDSGHAAILEMKEHPLRQVYFDQIDSLDRNDMTIVDVND